MYCTNCGQLVSEDWKYCNYCGTQQKNSQPSENLKNGDKKINYENSQGAKDLEYTTDKAPTHIGIIILISYIALYFIFTNVENKELAKLIILLSYLMSFIMRILVTIWVVNISNKLRRNSLFWGVITMFLPAIALIVIGQKGPINNA